MLYYGHGCEDALQGSQGRQPGDALLPARPLRDDRQTGRTALQVQGARASRGARYARSRALSVARRCREGAAGRAREDGREERGEDPEARRRDERKNGGAIMPAKGDGITKRKDGLYVGRVVVHTPGGPKRKAVYGRKYGEVEKKLNALRADADRGIVFDAESLKVGEWLDSWLSDCLKPLVDAGKMAHSTYVRYRGIVDKHLKPALGHRKLKDVTRAEVRKLYASKGETLSPRSVDYIHVTQQTALSRAVRDDLIARNVAEGERPRSSRERRSDDVKALSPAQVRALLDAARGTRNEALYIVALHTGLRQDELLGLKWSDLDGGKVSVRRALKIADHGLDFGSPKNKTTSPCLALRAHAP